MKKLLLYITCFTLILVLSACGTKKIDKSEVIAKSIEESTALKSYSIAMDMDIDVDDTQQKVSVNGDVTHNPDAMYLEMNMEALGMEITSEMYMNQDEIYMNMFDEWIKMDTDDLGISSFDQLNKESMDKLNDFAEDIVMTEEDNQYVLTLSGNDDTYKALIEDYISSSMGSELAIDADMEELFKSLKINKINLEYHVDKESFVQTTQIFDIDLEMEIEGTKVPMKMKGEATISNMNGVDPIEIPQDAIDNAVTEDDMYSYGESMTVDEIQELTSYQLVEPSELPNGYVYTEGYYDESMEMAMLSYDKDENNWVMVSSNPVEYLGLQDMEGEDIAVRGTNGVLYEMEDYISISWEENGLLYEVSTITNELSKEQLVEIIESLK
ncbi:MAG TPA: DUF4367 domain-containing protein [Ureibacillus sp.]|nr:DUF4367 domain-containing protein [Ureibacillus sp.]